MLRFLHAKSTKVLSDPFHRWAACRRPRNSPPWSYVDAAVCTQNCPPLTLILSLPVRRGLASANRTYSADHLGRLIRKGQLPNYGREHAPGCAAPTSPASLRLRSGGVTAAKFSQCSPRAAFATTTRRAQPARSAQWWERPYGFVGSRGRSAALGRCTPLRKVPNLQDGRPTLTSSPSERAIPFDAGAGAGDQESRRPESKDSPMTIDDLGCEDAEHRSHPGVAQPVTVVVEARERSPAAAV
jgi:hypothetical protein